jgi:hypothetical protein
MIVAPATPQAGIEHDKRPAFPRHGLSPLDPPLPGTPLSIESPGAGETPLPRLDWAHFVRSGAPVGGTSANHGPRFGFTALSFPRSDPGLERGGRGGFDFGHRDSSLAVNTQLKGEDFWLIRVGVPGLSG